MRRVTLVAAVALNGVIGRDGGIPWRLPADFAHFKRVTIGHPLVLGRKTFEGIGRPLPGRQSLVVTSDPDWAYEGVLVARSVEEAIARGHELDDVVSIGGGGRLYIEAMPLATDQILSEVQARPEGDTYYPDFDRAEWTEAATEEHPEDEPAWVVRWLERR